MTRVVEKTKNGGRWTVARFKGFIISALRGASNRWPPKYEAKKNAKLRYGVYQCAGYKTTPHEVRASEVQVDHINPVIDPSKGFTTWDDYIDRLFVESEGFQVLCRSCHKQKTSDEKELRVGH